MKIEKIDTYIEIVASNNPRLNDLPEEARLTILAALQQRYSKVAITIVDNMEDLENLVAKKPDLVVLGMGLVPLDASKNYDDSPKVWLSNYLQENGINFTGSGTEALLLQRNKHEAKQKVMDAGLHSSAYFVSTILQPTFAHNLTFPLFVKPTNRGDGKGIDEKSVVYNEAELQSKIVSIHDECGSDALIEEYLPGREFSVAVVKQSDSNELFAMPIELTTPADTKGNSFLSEAIKKADSEQVLIINDSELRNSLTQLAMGVFKALGSRDYGRIDLRLDASGVPHFIEANLMPGLSDHGYLSRCFAMNKQIPYDAMILSIIDLALKREAELVS